jgi:hypothetical protein
MLAGADICVISTSTLTGPLPRKTQQRIRNTDHSLPRSAQVWLAVRFLEIFLRPLLLLKKGILKQRLP